MEERSLTPSERKRLKWVVTLQWENGQSDKITLSGCRFQMLVKIFPCIFII